MKAAAIVYASNTGFTERYARMLGDRTGLPVYDMAGSSLPGPGTEIVYLGWLMAGNVKGLSRAAKRWKLRSIAAVGMSPDGMWDRKSVRRYEGTQVFYLQGGLAPDRLGGLHRLMIGMAARGLEKARGEHVDEMRRAFAQGCDLVDAGQLEPLLAWLGGNDG